MDKYHDLEPVSLYFGPYSIIVFLIEQNSWNSAKFLPLLIHSSAGERFSFVCRSAWYTGVADDILGILECLVYWSGWSGNSTDFATNVSLCCNARLKTKISSSLMKRILLCRKVLLIDLYDWILNSPVLGN